MDSSEHKTIERDLAMAYRIDGRWVVIDVERLRQVRLHIKMHKRELGAKLGTSRNQIDRLENGKCWLSLEQAKKLYDSMHGNPSIFRRVLD